MDRPGLWGIRFETEILLKRKNNDCIGAPFVSMEGANDSLPGQDASLLRENLKQLEGRHNHNQQTKNLLQAPFASTR